MTDELVTLPRKTFDEMEAELARLREQVIEAPPDLWAERWALYRSRVRARERGEEEEP